MSEVIAFINQTGFPIFVAVYVLVRLEKVIRDNTGAMKSIIDTLQSKSTGKGG